MAVNNMPSGNKLWRKGLFWLGFWGGCSQSWRESMVVVSVAWECRASSVHMVVYWKAEKTSPAQRWMQPSNSTSSDLLLLPSILRASQLSKWHALGSEGSKHEPVGGISDLNCNIQDLKVWPLGTFCTALVRRVATAVCFRVHSELKLPRFKFCLHHLLAFKTWLSPSIPFPVILNCAKGRRAAFSPFLSIGCSPRVGGLLPVKGMDQNWHTGWSTKACLPRWSTAWEGGGCEGSVPISQWPQST